MLWKLAYAELLFVPEHWPDLVKSEKIWQRVLDEYATRDRRFGGGKKKDYSGKNRGK
jgi:undecaprenyl diphosphate synthase